MYYKKYLKYKIKYLILKELSSQIKYFSSQSNNTIIITAPHTVCLNDKENICDQTSLKRAGQLKNLFMKNNVNVIFHDAKTHRSVCDFNRYECRDTLYNQIFKYLIKNNQNMLHLDIHSFPDKNSFDQTGDFVILAKGKNKEVAHDLINTMKDNNNIKYTRGVLEGGENFLINYSSGINYNGINYNNINPLKLSLLLEFNDQYNFTDNDLEPIINFILNKYFK